MIDDVKIIARSVMNGVENKCEKVYGLEELDREFKELLCKTDLDSLANFRVSPVLYRIETILKDSGAAENYGSIPRSNEDPGKNESAHGSLEHLMQELLSDWENKITRPF